MSEEEISETLDRLDSDVDKEYIELPNGNILYNSSDYHSVVHLETIHLFSDTPSRQKHKKYTEITSLCGQYEIDAVTPLDKNNMTLIKSPSHVCWNCVQSLRARDEGAVRDLQKIARSNDTYSLENEGTRASFDKGYL